MSHARSREVLQRILENARNLDRKKHDEAPNQDFLSAEAPKKKRKLKGRPGRPKVQEHLKARNITLCLARRYVEFLDALEVKDPKVQGRGRKIRFLIDEFMGLHQRQRRQLQFLKESLKDLDQVLKTFSGKVIKGEKLQLSPREKSQITQQVKQVTILIKVLSYTPKELQRLLPKSEWSLVAFCLDWGKRHE